MRDFEMYGRGFGRRGHHRFAKPLIISVIVVFALGLLVMSLWNALLPTIIGVKSIGFWQALGLLVLCRILFGGLGMRPGMFGMHRRMHDRWMQMTPEQRDEFIRQRRSWFEDKWGNRCQRQAPRNAIRHKTQIRVLKLKKPRINNE